MYVYIHIYMNIYICIHMYMYIHTYADPEGNEKLLSNKAERTMSAHHREVACLANLLFFQS